MSLFCKTFASCTLIITATHTKRKILKYLLSATICCHCHHHAADIIASPTTLPFSLPAALFRER